MQQNVSLMCISVPVLMVHGIVLAQCAWSLPPVRTQSFSVKMILIAVFPPYGSAIMKTTVGTVLMSSAPLLVLLDSSAALGERVYPWSSAVMAILTALTSLMRSTVLRLQQFQGVLLGSSFVPMDAACLPLTYVMEDWTVGLLMTQMNEVNNWQVLDNNISKRVFPFQYATTNMTKENDSIQGRFFNIKQT